MSADSPSFEDLVARCRRGDADAMRRLAEGYECELRIVAKAHVGVALQPYIDSTDLVQSVHRSLLVGLRNDRFSIETPEQLVGLALTIVRRKAARHWRRLRRQQRLSGGHDGSAILADLLIDRGTQFDEPSLQASRRETLERTLRDLDDSDRSMIELRLLGYSTVDAASQLGLNADVTRVRLSRLRKKLRQSGVDEDLF
ncbi:MAG: sigma-70 family RNA polymerase sigma factor [Planctomycetota bacterium]